MVKQFEVHLVALDPTIGSEIKKTRPCVIISPDEMNKYLNTAIIAPMTSTTKGYPSRVSFTFQKKKGEVALDQLRTVDKKRLVKKVGKTDTKTQRAILSTLQEMFA